MSILPLTINNIKGYAEYKFKKFFKGVFEILNGTPPQSLLTSIKNIRDAKSVYIILLIKEGSNIGHYITLMVVNKNNKKYGFWFDPMGVNSVSPKLTELFTEFSYNKKIIQKIGTESCGLFALREALRFLHIIH
jgi:hypothetical protein